MALDSIERVLLPLVELLPVVTPQEFLRTGVVTALGKSKET